MVAAVETHQQGYARAAGALYRLAIVALVGAALLGPAILTSDFKTGAVQLRLGCAFTCIELAAVSQEKPATPQGQPPARDELQRAVAARPDDLEITVSLSALRPEIRNGQFRARPSGEPARTSL